MKNQLDFCHFVIKLMDSLNFLAIKFFSFITNYKIDIRYGNKYN